MQAKTKRQATHSEVFKQIAKLKQYHQQGGESRLSKVPVAKQAKNLGWTIAKLDKARWFAEEYGEDDLVALFDSLKEHRPLFGVTHMGLLVTFRGHDSPKRDELQAKCIAENWSKVDLQHQMEMRVGSRNCVGGRRPHVTAATTTIKMSKIANTFLRFVNELKLTAAAPTKKMNRQLQKAAKEVGLLWALAATELKKQRKGM